MGISKLEHFVTLLYVFSTGSKKEREVYNKAGRRVTDLTDEGAELGHLQLFIKHTKPVFGTDFDVIVEVWSA